MDDDESTAIPPLSAEEAALIAKLTEKEIEKIDDMILANAHSHWRKVARIVGTLMGSLGDRYSEISIVFYVERIRALAEAGWLESQGDISHIRSSEVRLPQRSQATGKNSVE